MREEPRRFDRHAQLAPNLVAAHALLAAGHQVNRHQPLAERQLAFLEYRPHANRELLAAALALVNAFPHRALAVELVGSQLVGRADYPAVRANRPFWPKLRFKK